MIFYFFFCMLVGTHSFCFNCIYQWGTNNVANCPLCKQHFEIISYFSTIKNTNIHVPIQTKMKLLDDDNNSIYDPAVDEASCYICDHDENEEQLLLCDRCTNACHTYCAGIYRDTIPNCFSRSDKHIAYIYRNESH